MVSPKCPGTPRMPSCVAAVAPSRLSETLFTPRSRSRLEGARSSVSRSRWAPGPPAARPGGPRATSSTRSARPITSPPVMTSTGGRAPNPASCRMSWHPSLVVSSPGEGSGIASARQCRQASSQARVVSQKTRIGASSKFTSQQWRLSAAHVPITAGHGPGLAAAGEPRCRLSRRAWENRAVIQEMSRAEIDDFMHEQVVGRVGCHVDQQDLCRPRHLCVGWHLRLRVLHRGPEGDHDEDEPGRLLRSRRVPVRRRLAERDHPGHLRGACRRGRRSSP